MYHCILKVLCKFMATLGYEEAHIIIHIFYLSQEFLFILCLHRGPRDQSPCQSDVALLMSKSIYVFLFTALLSGVLH